MWTYLGESNHLYVQKDHKKATTARLEVVAQCTEHGAQRLLLPLQIICEWLTRAINKTRHR